MTYNRLSMSAWANHTRKPASARIRIAFSPVASLTLHRYPWAASTLPLVLTCKLTALKLRWLLGVRPSGHGLLTTGFCGVTPWPVMSGMILTISLPKNSATKAASSCPSLRPAWTPAAPAGIPNGPMSTPRARRGAACSQSRVCRDGAGPLLRNRSANSPGKTSARSTSSWLELMKPSWLSCAAWPARYRARLVTANSPKGVMRSISSS